MVEGQRISVTGDTEAQATAKALAIREQLIEAAKTPRDAITLEAAIEKYIAARDKVLSPATIRGYHVILKNRFPDLMKKKIYQINEAELQAAINSEAETKSYKTIKNSIGLILSVLNEYKTLNVKRLRFPQRKGITDLIPQW